jgi:putative nucleotidyltransferase with HDIG domain
MKPELDQLLRSLEGVIHAVSTVVEIRDPYTAGHQRRVAELAGAIAREMNLSEWAVAGIHIAGLLHDVGKIAVPMEILSKAGKINRHEYAIIKNHCLVGSEILQRVPFPWPVTQVILQHHERIDGSGYPRGLTGDNIVLAARILSVADVVEAMSSHRPYRAALGLECALEEISASIGVLYDSDAAGACLKLFKDNEREFDRLMTAASGDGNISVMAVRD